MKKPNKLKPGDQVAIVSLSIGILGEEPIAPALNLGIKRLKEFGLEPVFMPNALKGVEFLATNPQAKASDLKKAFLDPNIKAIITAIGGDDTYQTLPYLLNDEEFKNAVKENPKIFIGFSDTTINHLMFQQLGLNTFYGHSFLVDFAELDNDMLPYSKKTFEMLFNNQSETEILPSEYWYQERLDLSSNVIGTPRVKHKETRGYEVLRGTGSVTGTLLGGCIDRLYDSLVDPRYNNQKEFNENYQLFPSNEQWKNKIMFLETWLFTSPKPPTEFKKMLKEFEKAGIFKEVVALMVGKPIDETYYEEYKEVLLEVTKKYNLPIIYNVNFGHAHPKTIIPYGLKTEIDFDQKRIFIKESFVN